MNRRFFLAATGAAFSALGMGRVHPVKPKYVFYMIGDGMGTAQRDIAEQYAHMKYPSRNPLLKMNQLPVTGKTTTVEINGKVTDSAAAGTALACGVKTVNGAVGVAADLKTPLRSMAYDAKDAGMKVGIVTSVPIDHATPASFYAEVPKRGMYYEIDEFLASSGFDYFAGETMLGRKKAGDKKPPQQLVEEAGYQIVQTRDAFDHLTQGAEKVLVEKDVGYAIDGDPEISLADFTRKGIELLDNPDGFFMMVEGGKIDWSGHANDLATNIHETLAFDDAVSVALEFCKKHPEESLLIVTADHETGGLEFDNQSAATLVASIDGQQHRASHYVDQVNTWKRTGSKTTEDALNALVSEFKLDELEASKAKHLKLAVKDSLSQGDADTRSPEIQKMYGKRNAAVTGCLHALANQAGAGWTTFGHTDFKVKTTAWGNWADEFGGELDNTELGLYLKALIATT